MSWFDSEEREGNHFGGEMFKKEVIRYYQTMGYRLITSSSHEGTLSDVIMEKPGEPKIYIETKAGKESIFAQTTTLRKEIFKYFYEWLKLEESQKFNMHIVVGGLSKKQETKKIFTSDAIEDNIIKWFQNRDDLNLQTDIEELFRTTSQDLIIKFFRNTTVRIIPSFKLSQIVLEREKEIKRNPDRKAKRLLKEVKSRRRPNNKANEIWTNFLELEFPSRIFYAETRFKRKKTIFDQINNQTRLPEFYFAWRENDPCRIYSFDENLEILENSIQGSIQEDKIDCLNFEQQIQFLYTHLRRFLWCKGLRRFKYRFFFAYNPPLDKELIIPIEENQPNAIENQGPSGLKVVSRPIYRSSGELYYVEHHAIKIKVGILDEKFGIYVWPRWLFSEDGVKIIEGDNASRISRKYLNPIYNRNLNKRSELNFWDSFLTNDDFSREKDLWFNNFRIKSLTRHKVSWISKTVEIDQYRLNVWSD